MEKENGDCTKLKLITLITKSEVICLPGRQNSMLILARANVFGDVRVLVTGHTRDGIIGFAHCEKEWCVVASGQLDDIRNQCCCTKTEHMNP